MILKIVQNGQCTRSEQNLFFCQMLIRVSICFFRFPKSMPPIPSVPPSDLAGVISKKSERKIGSVRFEQFSQQDTDFGQK